MHQNKALHIFHIRGQRSIVERNVCLEYALVGYSKSQFKDWHLSYSNCQTNNSSINLRWRLYLQQNDITKYYKNMQKHVKYIQLTVCCWLLGFDFFNFSFDCICRKINQTKLHENHLNLFLTSAHFIREQLT